MIGNTNIMMSKTTDLITELGKLRDKKQRLLQQIKELDRDVQQIDSEIERVSKELGS